MQLSETVDCVLVYKQYLAKPDEVVNPLTRKDFFTIVRKVLKKLGTSWKSLEISNEFLSTREAYEAEFDKVANKIISSFIYE